MMHSSELALCNAKQCRELARTSLSSTAQQVLEEMAADFERAARSISAGDVRENVFNWTYGTPAMRL